jgi:hypothetical protein
MNTDAERRLAAVEALAANANEIGETYSIPNDRRMVRLDRLRAVLPPVPSGIEVTDVVWHDEASRFAETGRLDAAGCECPDCSNPADAHEQEVRAFIDWLWDEGLMPKHPGGAVVQPDYLLRHYFNETPKETS